MKKSIYFLAIVLIASCSQPGQNPGDSGNSAAEDGNNSNSGNTIVEVQKLMPIKFQHFIEINGSIRAEKDAMVSPETMGQIKNIYVTEGDKVKKGQLLVSLNTSVTESTIREVKTSLDLATETYSKQKE